MSKQKPLPPSYLCPACGVRSYHPEDVAERYCTRCKMFEADRVAFEAEPLTSKEPEI
jgi:ribosomal protein L37E